MVNLTKHVAQYAASPEAIDRGAALDNPPVFINIDRMDGARLPYFVNDDGSTPPLLSPWSKLDMELDELVNGRWLS